MYICKYIHFSICKHVYLYLYPPFPPCSKVGLIITAIHILYSQMLRTDFFIKTKTSRTLFSEGAIFYFFLFLLFYFSSYFCIQEAPLLTGRIPGMLWNTTISYVRYSSTWLSEAFIEARLVWNGTLGLLLMLMDIRVSKYEEIHIYVLIQTYMDIHLITIIWLYILIYI
jgi:hypothetical protein